MSSGSLLAAVRSYREAMRGFAGQGDLAVWYARLDVEESMGRVEAADPGSVKRFERGIAKARSKGQRAGDGKADRSRRR